MTRDSDDGLLELDRVACDASFHISHSVSLQVLVLPSFYKLRTVVRERGRERAEDLLLSPLKETRVHIALPRAERKENGDRRQRGRRRE